MNGGNRLEDLADIPCDNAGMTFSGSHPITIGYSIVCDGYSPGRTTAIFSHFHEDHTHHIKRTLTHCDNVILSKVTYDVLRKTRRIPERGTIRILSEGTPFHTEFEKIELFNANHVPGSMQTLVTMKDNGERILYSGDFSYPGITVPKADVLVLEAEHGEPVHDFEADRGSILRRIFDTVMSEINDTHPIEIKAHSGTMQEIMAHLETAVDGKLIPERVPFLADERVIQNTNALRQEYCKEIRNIEEAKSLRLNELYENQQPYVLFSHHGKPRPQEDRGKIIHVDANLGFRKNGPFFTHDGHTYYACLSSHSSFSHIKDYVKEVCPSIVIVDGTRASTNTAEKLRSTIQTEFGIQAVVKSCIQ